MKILLALFSVFLIDFALSQYNSTEREGVDVKESNRGSENNSNASLKQQPNQKCIELNQQREDLASCCDYPQIHFYQIYSTHCVDECIGSKDFCCSALCIWRNTKVKFEDEKVNLDGLKETLLQSVKHKGEWEFLISRAVDQCFGGIF